MKTMNVTVCLATALALVVCGCRTKMAPFAGYLSDYSNLTPHSDTSYRYGQPEKLSGYTRFIIDPIDLHFHEKSRASTRKIEELEDMMNYMHDALLKAISDEYLVVYQPGPGVARIRVGLTDLKAAKRWRNYHPPMKLVGSGLGGASLEAEILDSVSHEQLAALVESKLGNRFRLEGLTKWGDAKRIMDSWAKWVRERLDEAHVK